MNKQLTVLAFFILMLIFPFNADAQMSLKLGGGLGYSVPASDYSGTTIDFYNGTKYGMESGFNIHGKVRLDILFISAFGEIGYTAFSASGESEPGQGSIDISHKMVSVKLGPELHIAIPMTPITPYILGFVSYNSISGNVDFQGVSDVPSGKYDIASASRIGLGAGAGVIFGLGGFELDFNLQYHVINIGGAEYNIENATSHTRLDNYTSLNDGLDPAYIANSNDHFIQNNRAIADVEFKLGIMFGL
jgi:opacity protein-like surface antigen